MNIFLIGSLAFDHAGQFKGRFSDVIKAEHLNKLSVSFFVEDQQTFLGGTCGNIAYSLGLLGNSAYITTLLGEDGASYLESLKSWGMKTEYLISLDGPTANAQMLTDLDENQISFFAPGVINENPPKYELPQIAEPGDILLVSPENKDRMIDAVTQGAEKGLKVFFDPGQQIHAFSKNELRLVLEKTDGLFVNDYEWELVTSISEWTYAEIQSKVATIFLTKGSGGVHIFHQDETKLVNAIKVENVADPTGAGDAFRGGVLAGLAKGLGIEDSAKIGVILGAACVQKKQTQGHEIPKDQLPVLEKLGFSL